MQFKSFKNLLHIIYIFCNDDQISYKSDHFKILVGKSVPMVTATFKSSWNVKTLTQHVIFILNFIQIPAFWNITLFQEDINCSCL